MVRVLRALNAAIRDLDRSVVARLDAHPDAEIFTSLPRSGRINAAQMLAEWGEARQAYDCPDAVGALAGMTPVTNRSGKHTSVGFRWGVQQALGQRHAHLRQQLRHGGARQLEETQPRNPPPEVDTEGHIGTAGGRPLRRTVCAQWAPAVVLCVLHKTANTYERGRAVQAVPAPLTADA
jgi:transposase IS116/IS110/IS902 family protein